MFYVGLVILWRRNYQHILGGAGKCAPRTWPHGRAVVTLVSSGRASAWLAVVVLCVNAHQAIEVFTELGSVLGSWVKPCGKREGIRKGGKGAVRLPNVLALTDHIDHTKCVNAHQSNNQAAKLLD